MEDVLDQVERGVARLRALAVGDLGALPAAGLVEFQEVAVGVKRAADALVALGAGEVARHL